MKFSLKNKDKNKKKIEGLGVGKIDEATYFFFYNWNDFERGTFKVRKSLDGIKFKTIRKIAKIVNLYGRSDELSQSSFVHLSKYGQYYYLTYRIRTSKSLSLARSKNIIDWEQIGEININEDNGKIVSDYMFRDYMIMYAGTKSISLYASKDKEKKEWLKVKKNVLEFKDLKENDKIFILETQITSEGIFMMYAKVRNAFLISEKDADKPVQYEIYALLLSIKNPIKILWQSKECIYKTENTLENVNTLLGAVTFDDYFVTYWKDHKGKLYLLRHPYKHEEETDDDEIKEAIETKQPFPTLERIENNPVLAPQDHYAWESKYVFNPTAISIDNKVHIIYRAIGDNDISVFGYAVSEDGINIHERLAYPVYVPRTYFEGTVSHPEQGFHDEFISGGGGMGGCEDPKLSQIGDTIYLIYVAYNGWSNPRLAMSSISVDDFLNRRWHKWAMPKLISRPHQTNKSGCILPEKINGKYVIFHRIFPNIKIDFVNSLEEFDGKTRWLEGQYEIAVREDNWDSGKLSVAATPLKTKEGWLLIYHAVTGRQEWEGSDLRYKVGAMLLDLNDPTKVIARSNKPILEPETDYENNGAKYGVVYPGGAIIKDDVLYIYYGGSDQFVCVATAPLNKFLINLKRTGEVKMSIFE